MSVASHLHGNLDGFMLGNTEYIIGRKPHIIYKLCITSTLDLKTKCLHEICII